MGPAGLVCELIDRHEAGFHGQTDRSLGGSYR